MKKNLKLAIALIPLTMMSALPAYAAPDCSLHHLRTEHLANPVGIDAVTPRFSWRMQDTRPGAHQQAYQIQAAATTAALASGPHIWDSARQETSASINIQYDGPALTPRTRYIWHVRAWDMTGQPTAWSEPAFWETGMMNEKPFDAEWIAGHYKEPTKAENFDGVTWVWYPGDSPEKKAPEGRRFFRYHFEMPEKKVASAMAWALVDNSAIVYINGEKAQTEDGWVGIVPKDVAKYFKPGKVNVIQIAAKNNSNGPAGLAWCANLTFDDGTTKRLSTDISWRTSVEPGEKWPEDGFGRGDWIAVQDLGEIGMEPWNNPVFPVDGGPATIHRKEFTAADAPESARLYITALGSYRAKINGQRVGNAVFTPDWTDYRDRVMYQTYDVTPLIKSGENAIGVTLGDGWYASGLGWRLKRYCFGEPPTRFMAELHLRYPDGTEKVIPTDDTWRTTQSAIRRSEIYYGEIYDARLEQDGWAKSGFDDSKWETSREPKTTTTIAFSAQASPPIRIAQDVKPIAITEPKPGMFIFDMGQNMVGWARLTVNGEAGDRVRMRFAEILNDDGTIYRENLRRAEATDTYILKGGGEEIFEPHFTYHGFRYIEVTGYPGGKPPMDAILGRVFHTDAAQAGSISTSNEMVNQVVENTQWGLWGNLMSVPTDCPQRDERLGWTGDAQAIWKTACYRMNLPAFSEKWLRDMRDAQSEAGDFPNVAPRIISTAPGAPAWGDAGIIVPYDTWKFYDDTRMVAEMWPAMEAWMNYIGEANPNHLWLKRRGNDYGDWVPADSKTDKDLIATAYWAQDARMMSEMATALDKDAEARKYDELYAKIRSAFQKKFIKPDGKIANGSQTCYVLALHNDLVQNELIDEAVAHLVADIESRDNHLSTGFLGTSYLMPVLTEHGKNDVAITLMLNKTYPSWGYMVEQGATTIWERWNSDTGDPSMNSFNHYCYGAVTDWLYGYLVGIRPASEGEGFKRILIEPHPDKRMEWARAKYESIYGPITSEWKYEDDKLALNIGVPANTTARISLPTDDAQKVQLDGKSLADAKLKHSMDNGRVILETGSGKYAFEIAQ